MSAITRRAMAVDSQALRRRRLITRRTITFELLARSMT
jgi:hypothetical protein